MTARFSERFSALLLVLAIALAFLFPGSLTINADAATSLRISSTVTSSFSFKGGTVKLKSAAAGGKAPYKYKFLYKIGSGSWKTIKAYSSSSSVSMKTEKAGKYTLRCYLKDKSGLQVYCDIKLDIQDKYIKLANKSTVSATTIKLDKTVKITGKGTGGTKPYKYAFYYKLPDSAEKTIKKFSKTAACTVRLPTAGYYTLRCVIKDADNQTVSKSFNVVVTNKMGTSMKNSSTLSATAIEKNKTLTITGKASGGYQPCRFAFAYSKDGGSFVKIADYGKNAVKTVKLKEPGYYRIQIQAKDQNGKVATKYRQVVVTGTTSKTLANKSTISTTTIVNAGTTIAIKGAASGGVQPYEYNYSYKYGSGSWKTIKDYSTESGASLVASTAGTYTVKVTVRDYKGTLRIKSYIIEALPDSVGDNVADERKIHLDYGLSLPVSADNAGDDAEYAFYYKKSGESVWTPLQDFDENRFVKFRPRYIGEYSLLVYTKVDGTVSSDAYLVETDISETAYRELEFINEERRNAGVPALELDPELTFAAGVRAEELEDYYSHTRPDGRSCFTVLDDYNVYYPGIVGENIASGYRSVDAVVDGWMNSKGHRENILSASFKKVGFGIYSKFWEQMFSD